MKKQGGFTLIELIVVIVILAILGVTAAPRFLNLQSDARKASLQGLKGALQGAAGIVYGKAAIQGLETISSGANVDGITIAYGYPTADFDGIVNAIVGGDIEDGGDWHIQSGASKMDFYFANAANVAPKPNCYVSYEPATSAAAPIVKVEADGC